MSELAIEFVILVVGNSQQTILDAKRVAKIFAHLMLRELDCPAVQVLTIK